MATRSDASLDQLKRLAQETNSKHDHHLRDRIVESIYRQAEDVAAQVITRKNDRQVDWDRRLDDLLTSRWTGIPFMLVLLGLVFWITLEGANIPSALLAKILFGIEEQLTGLFFSLGAPAWLHGLLVLGAYRTLAWVVAVMLPPMAIFFPLFTFLEDLGYLPRVAFNLDHWFKRAGAHGKQALTMCMGFGCNAAGVVACRIIESPRERLIAMVTNNFVPCNGRFPTLITLATIFMGGLVATGHRSFIAVATIMVIILIGVFVTLAVSWLLSHTLLKGVPSTFTLELPPYRKPQLGRIIYRSIIDRTIFVLGRAAAVAAPAGALTWLLANTMVGGQSIIALLAGWLQPIGILLGLDGFIVMAFLLGFPANEIVLPILFMSYLSQGAMPEIESLDAIRSILVSNGWTWLTAVNAMLFSLLHFPCATTLWTMRSESGSMKWPLITTLLTTAIAIGACFLTTQTARLLGLV